MALERAIFYRRNLPHWQPAETDFFVTYRLAGSIPKSQIIALKETYTRLKNLQQKNPTRNKFDLTEAYFHTFDDSLDRNLNEPYWLQQKEIGQRVMDSLLFNNKKFYHLWCACIMSNHVHVVLSTIKEAPSLDIILQNHKKFTALHCNRILGREGQFWHHESFDRIIRNDRHFISSVNYTLNNPVIAGFVSQWRNWEFTYVDEKLGKEFDD